MGYVYQAEQLGLGRVVAIKLLRRELIQTRFDWFRAEAMAASRINHPHAVAIYDFGVTEDGIPYLVMEHLRGETMSRMIERGPLDAKRIVTLGAQVLSALAEAHACGVVHCDLTGENVIVERLRAGEDFAKVIDFGLARLFDSPTRDRTIVGTAEYMAPEQIRGELINPRTDLYATGVLLYEMIVGRTPFESSSVAVILDAHVNAVPVAPHEIVSSCPRALSDLVMQALEKNPELRPESAGTMRDALLAALAGGQPSIASASHTIQSRTATLRFGAAAERARMRPQDPPPRRRTSRIGWDHAELGFGAMVGRKTELSRIVGFCRGQTRARVLAITGATGVGKARVMTEGARRAQPATSYVAAADPSRLRTPWYPVLSMLESILGVRGSLSYEDLTRAAAALGVPERDMPGLAEIFALPGPAEALELNVRRREAHAAARRTLLAIGNRVQGAVLCFADIDRYDHPSAKLVRDLCDAVGDSQIRVIVTARNDPQIGGAEVLELAGLPALSSHELATQLAGPTAQVPGPDAVHALTSGSPAAIEQLAGWLEMGNAAADAPATLVDSVTVRVNRLPATARRVLQAVAIHGTVTPRWLAEACLGEDEMSALDQFRWTGLLQASEDEVRIPSELVAHVILECTPADVRRRLHWRALEALGHSGAIGVLAHHAEQAGEISRAFEHSMHAGNDSVRRFDDPGAAVWYGRAVAMARELHARGIPEASRDLIDASILLAEVLRMSGEPSLALGVLDEAELFQPDDRQRARMERQRGLAAVQFGNDEAALHHIHTAIGRAIRGGDPEFLCQAYLDLARTLDSRGNSAQALSELEQAIDLITLGQGLNALSAPGGLWRVAFALAERQLGAGDTERARTTATAALAQARRVGYAHARGRASALLAHICESLGDYQTALAHRANAIEEMRQLGDRRSTAELLIESAHATRRRQRDPKLARWTTSPGDAMRLARELADEIGWQDGVARTSDPS